MPFKVKVKTADGNLVEGELETLPDGVISEEQYSERFQKELGRRATSIERKARETALEDEEFRATALQKWGIDVAKLAQAGDLTKEKIDQLREEIRKGEVGPLTEKLSTAEQRVQKLLGKRLEAEILRIAAARVKPEFLKGFGKDAEPVVVSNTRGLFEYDPESDDFYRKGSKPGEFVFSRSGKARYQTVEEAFDSLAEDKEFADLFLDKRPPGPGFQEGHRRGGDIVLSREQAGSLAAVQAAEKQAKEQGVKVVYGQS